MAYQMRVAMGLDHPGWRLACSCGHDGPDRLTPRTVQHYDMPLHEQWHRDLPPDARPVRPEEKVERRSVGER